MEPYHDNLVPKPKMDSIEFSYGKVLNDILTPKNGERLLKITGCWLNAQRMLFQSFISSDEKLKHEASIYLAANAEHKITKILETYNKVNFGDLLLISSRNIASKEVLRNEEDKVAYCQLRDQLSQAVKDNNLEDLLGYDTSYFTESFLNSLKGDYTPKSVNTSGVCFSSNLYLISKIFNDPRFQEGLLDEEMLIHHIHEIQKGVPGEVAAKQEVFHELDFINFTGENKRDFSTEEKKLNFANDCANIIFDRADRQKVALPPNFSKELHLVIGNVIREIEKYNELNSRYLPNKAVATRSDIFAALFPHEIEFAPSRKKKFLAINEQAFVGISEENKLIINKLLKNFDLVKLDASERCKSNAIAHLYGFKQDIEGRAIANGLLGDFENYRSSKEHLRNFENFEPGMYEAAFKTDSGYHSILYMKLANGDGYIFDPNKGLIKCGNFDHSSVFLKILSTYPPPEDKLDNENEDRNYRVRFNVFNPIRNDLQDTNDL